MDISLEKEATSRRKCPAWLIDLLDHPPPPRIQTLVLLRSAKHSTERCLELLHHTGGLSQYQTGIDYRFYFCKT